jgi:hypothetical protein
VSSSGGSNANVTGTAPAFVVSSPAGSPSQTRLSSNDHHSNDQYYIIINGSKARPGGTNMLRDRDYSTLLFRQITSHKVL